jgi:hypothetical protein
MVEVVRVGTEFLVNTETVGDQQGSSITGLANGGFVVTWTDDSGTLGDSSDLSIKAQVFTAGGAKVGSEFLVNTQTAGLQQLPTITGLANGGFVATWTDYGPILGDYTDPSVKAQVFTAGGAKLGTEFLVNTQTAGRQSNSTIAGLANGGFVVTWSDDSLTLGDSSDLSIKAQVFTAGGDKVGTEFLVNTQTTNSQYGPTITGLANGRFVVTWTDNSGSLGDRSGTSIKAQVFTAGGAKVGNEFLVNTKTADFQGGSTITGLENGDFVVTWSDGNGTLSDIKAQVFTAGGAKVGSEFLVSTQTAGFQELPKITGLKNGGFVVSWPDFSEGFGLNVINTSIRAQVFAAGGAKVGTEFLVKLQLGVGNPLITGLDNGGFVVTWGNGISTLGDGSGASIKAQIFELSGNTTPQNSAPEITSDGGGATAAVTIAENTAAVATVHAADPDAGTTLVYLISGGADAARFQINAATGALAFLTAPNFETPTDDGGNNIYDVIIRASDGTLFDEQAIAVTVTNAFDTFTGTALRDTLTGTNDADIILGLASNDTLNGLGGNDVLDGGSGNDIMNGGLGDDTYIVDAISDKSVELADQGTDTVLTAIALYKLGDNVENLSFTYTEGSGGKALGNAIANVLTGAAGADSLLGYEGGDTLLGFGGIDSLNGGTGNDVLDGGTGGDTLIGGFGDDLFIVDDLGDVVREGADAGTDRVESSVTFIALANVENLTLTGTGAVNGTTGRLANVLTGNNADNVLFSAGGNDTVLGLDGNDTLNGGSGQDRLTGGLGGDTFLFTAMTSASLGSSVDVVTDFSRIEGDKLAFSKAIFNGLGAVGALEAAAFQTGTVALDATDRVIYDAATGNLYYDPDGSGRRAQVFVATIGDEAPAALSFDDFLIMA